MSGSLYFLVHFFLYSVSTLCSLFLYTHLYCFLPIKKKKRKKKKEGLVFPSRSYLCTEEDEFANHILSHYTKSILLRHFAYATFDI